MRPVLLEFEGFGAFREPTVVDFADAEFFALVGPTGSGKSTVIDAICFALYGNVPRYDDQRLVGAAMSLGAAEAKVRLTFEVAGERFVVARVVRRSGQGKVATKEARLERGGVLLAGRESELRAAVESVLGLSFDDFTRCVVLPQGAFARFLHDKPAERQALLVRLLDLGVYQRLVGRANARAARHQRELDRLEGQLSELPVAGEAELQELAAAVERLRTVRSVLDTVEPAWQQTQAEATEARLAVERDEAVVRALARIGAPPWVARHRERSARAQEELARADAALAAAQEAVDRAAERLAAGPEPAVLEAAVRAHERIGKGIGVVADLERAAALDRQAAEAAVAEVERAEAERRRATAALHDAEAAHRAHALALTLQPGEPCPVCEHPVDRLPLPVSPPGLDDRREAQRRAEAAERRARELADAAGRTAASSEAKHAATLARLEELRADVADRPDPVAVAAERDRVAAVAAELEARRTELRRCTEAVAAGRAAIEQGAADQARAWTEYHAQRDAVAALEPPAPGPEPGPSWDALSQWAESRRPELDARRSAALEAFDEARRRGDTYLAQVLETAGRAGLELPKPATFAAVRTALGRAEAGVDQRRIELERATVRRAELTAAAAAAQEARSVATELARHLKADRFQRWLVDAAFRQLADAASATLRRLSDGQFSLDVNDSGEFVVIDHTAADERRPVRTLSGGETFQASLALALSLSQHVMELGAGSGGTTGRRALESIFLDEGFGTLDPDSLETVAATIEALGDDGRMVGIVTHVQALADRVPVRFRVWRDTRTAHVERIDG